MRGPPTHDFNDIMMKQKVADSVLQRFGGEETATNGPKVGKNNTNPSSKHTFAMKTSSFLNHLFRKLFTSRLTIVSLFLACPQTIQLPDWSLL